MAALGTVLTGLGREKLEECETLEEKELAETGRGGGTGDGPPLGL